MQAQLIINDAQDILNDLDFTTYKSPEILRWINDAQRFVCSYRNDACSSINSFALVAGSKQTIPATARRLADVVRNMGGDGVTIGRSIVMGKDMDDLDSFNPDWHNEIDSEVQSYFFDERFPDTFYIYPQVSLPHYLEIKTLDNPADVTSEIDDINVLDIYAPVLVSWVVYRALSKDSDNSPNVARAQEHKATAFEILGVKTQSDLASSPNSTNKRKN